MTIEGSKEAFDALIASNSGDVNALTALDEQLKKSNAPWARLLRIRIIDLRRKLPAYRSEAPPTTPRIAHAPNNPVAQTYTANWVAPFNISPPDGRPLYQYRLSSASFASLEKHLKERARPNGFERPEDDALFVLWAAEWFRRCFSGGFRRWSDIGAILGFHLSQGEWRTLADRGLRIWKLRPLRLNGATHRLLSLARQGGFPVAALEREGNGWAASYLERLVGVLLAEPDPTADAAYRHAEALAGLVPDTWRSNDFFVVSADLAQAVLQLRRTAEENGTISGIPPSVWLDVNRPNWRDTLPLVVDGESGRRLIDGLMKAAAVKGGSGTIRATRILEKTTGVWQPRSLFELNGRLRIADFPLLDTNWSRLRMFAGTELARYVPGELAIVELGENGDLVSLASSSRQLVAPVPLHVPVEVELRGGGHRVGTPIQLPNGGAVSGSLIVCYSECGDGGEIPDRLIVAGAGSGKYRADPLYVFVPEDWSILPGEHGESSEPLEERHNSLRLWRVRGGATIASPTGDHYRLLAGQKLDERDVLIVHGDCPLFCKNAAGPTPVIQGKPKLVARSHRLEQPLRDNEAWWRQTGDREWLPFSSFSALGNCEFAWRDHTTRHLRDRQAAIIVPTQFTLNMRRSGERVELSVQGWPGQVTVHPGREVAANTWSLSTRGASEAVAIVRLVDETTRPFELQIQLPHQPWITDWMGKPLLHGAKFSLGTMHRLVARAEGRCQLLAQLRDRNGTRIHGAESRWSFEQELPLNGIRDDIAALLRPLADLDASVELTFNDAQQACWYASEFDLELKREPGGLVPARAIIDESVRMAGRALHTPWHEVDLGHFDLTNYRPFHPTHLEGSWLVYLRAGESALSRPFLLSGKPLARNPDTLLGCAMMVADRDVRQNALLKLCVEAENDGVRGQMIVKEIINLVVGLAGLPPSTFDILHLVAKRPLLAARLMFEAAEHELRSLSELSRGLPFAWSLIPRRCWLQAAKLRFESILTALPSTLANPIAIAAATIAKTRELIAEIEPTTAMQLDQPVTTRPITEVAQAFIQRALDRAETFAQSPFRPQFERRLPSWQFSECYWPALDAPCAAALVAAEVLTLDAGQLRCVKEIARRHPRYFEEAFAAIFKEISFG